VEVVDVRPEAIRDVVDLVGQLDAELSVQIRPEISGVIASIEFQEGQAVAKGDVLFRLNDDEQRARLQEAEAERELSRAVFERTRKLADRDISSAAQLDKARAELARDVARVEASRTTLERTTLRAPFDGMMGARLVSPGARVEPEDVLGQIDHIDRLQLVFTLPESVVALARTGLPFEFGVAPYPGETFRGEIVFLAPTIDPATRRMLVKGLVPNPDRRLRPGLFANIRAEIGRNDSALVLPESALALDREGTFVWRVTSDDAAERAGVETGIRTGGRVEIVNGLQAGDRVVAAGTNKVRAGSRVRAAGPEGSSREPSTAEVGEGGGEGS
jgi:membrane fusion protein (multidrug efflux system)